MKKMMMIAAMMIAAMNANAQNEVGQVTLQPKVGMNISKITGSDMKTKAGLTAGFEAEYGVAENFGITAGLLYSMQGAKRDFKGVADGVNYSSTFKLNIDYINIPVLAQYYVVKGLAVKAGVQFGFVVRNKAKLDGSAVGISIKDDWSVNEFLDYCKQLGPGIPNDAKLNKFDFSIPVGLSYEYESFVLDARYNIGTSKVIKGDSGKNGVFQLTIGYKFAL